MYKKCKKKCLNFKIWTKGKSGLGEYLTMNFRHFLLSCNLFWWSGDFLDTIGPSRSVCSCQYPLMNYLVRDPFLVDNKDYARLRGTNIITIISFEKGLTFLSYLCRQMVWLLCTNVLCSMIVWFLFMIKAALAL